MRVFSRRELFAVACAFVLIQPASAQISKLQTFEKDELSIRTKQAVHKFRVEIARRPNQHMQGLMFRRQLAANAGMLFLYSKPTRANMWMKNTFIPLDMLYIDGTGKIVGFSERAVPGSLQVISSSMPVIAVLEVNAGTVSNLNIAVGDQVLYPAFQTGAK